MDSGRGGAAGGGEAAARDPSAHPPSADQQPCRPKRHDVFPGPLASLSRALSHHRMGCAGPVPAQHCQRPGL